MVDHFRYGPAPDYDPAADTRAVQAESRRRRRRPRKGTRVGRCCVGSRQHLALDLLERGWGWDLLHAAWGRGAHRCREELRKRGFTTWIGALTDAGRAQLAALRGEG